MNSRTEQALYFCIEQTETQILEYYDEALDYMAGKHLSLCANAVKDMAAEFDRLGRLCAVEHDLFRWAIAEGKVTRI